MNKTNENKTRCPWCTDPRGRTELGFSIIDDDFGQYVHYNMIKFCPFCGRKLIDDNQKANRRID